MSAAIEAAEGDTDGGLCGCSCCAFLPVAPSSAGDLRLEALSLLLHRSPAPFTGAVVLRMVASRLMAVATSAAAAAGRTTQDSYGVKQDRAVVATDTVGRAIWLVTDGRLGGEPPFEHDDDDEDDSDGERLSRPPAWSDEDMDDMDEGFLWWWPPPLLLSEFALPLGCICASAPI